MIADAWSKPPKKLKDYPSMSVIIAEEMTLFNAQYFKCVLLKKPPAESGRLSPCPTRLPVNVRS